MEGRYRFDAEREYNPWNHCLYLTGSAQAPPPSGVKPLGAPIAATSPDLPDAPKSEGLIPSLTEKPV